MREALGSQRVLVRKLEDLTTKEDSLRDLIYRINPNVEFSGDSLKSMQLRDVNRKVQGDRSAENLWSKWTPEQRQAFVRICGNAMDFYGYRIP
jgi:hypothetical protein